MDEGRIILTDKPLEDPELDRLNYVPFAKRVADIIKSLRTTDSLVFAVYGEWGSGKSTFLNFIEFYLKNKISEEDNEIESENDSIIITWFNPWWFSGKEALLFQFFEHLKVSLNKTDKFKEVLKKLKPFIAIISGLPYLGGANIAINEILSESLIDLKKEISKYLEEIDRKIVIMIDDIDRLSSKEIRELFTIIKAIADFPNIIYILAFDKDVVIRSLEKVQEGKGEEYLEKIIQVPLELPRVNKPILRNVLLEEVTSVISEPPDELFNSHYFGNVYWDGIDPFIETFRDVKRLVNVIRITYPSIKNDVNAVDFIALETMRIFCHEVYYYIRNNPTLFCGLIEEKNDLETYKKFYENWLESLEYDDFTKAAIKNLLKRLFPKFKSAFDYIQYSVKYEQRWRAQKRVCCEEIFPRYFLFSVPSYDISKEEMERVLALLPDKYSFIERLKMYSNEKCLDSSTKLSVFFERLLDHSKYISKVHIPFIIEIIFGIGDQFITSEDEKVQFLISIGNDIRMAEIVNKLLQRFSDKEERFRILNKAFEEGSSISMMAKEITLLWARYNESQNQKGNEEEYLLEKVHLEELQKLVLNKIKELAEKDRLLTTPLLPLVLGKWQEWEGEEGIEKWVNEILASDEKLPKFLAKFLQKNRSFKKDDRVYRTFWRLNPEWLKDLVDLNLLERRCEEILSNGAMFNNLEEKEKLAILQFLEEKKLIDEGKNPDYYLQRDLEV